VGRNGESGGIDDLVVERCMGKELHYCPVMRLNGKPVYIFKFLQDDGRTRSQVEEIATKAQSTLRGGDYSPDIVIMVGEPGDQPKLFGSLPSVSYIRSILPTLGDSSWAPAVLD
jgi:hypothetical protein